MNNLFQSTPDVFDNIDTNIEFTPIQKHGDIYIKREDLFTVFDVCGAKARQAYTIIKNSDKNIVITAGSKKSPQIQIVANICKHLKKECYCYTMIGELTDELKIAKSDGANIVQIKGCKHCVVAIYHAIKEAKRTDALYVPFGMEDWEAIKQTALQVQNIPRNIKQIVITAGSGINLCGVLWGIKLFHLDTKVKAISVGADITKTLEKYAPCDYRNYCSIIKSEYGYETKIGGIIDDIVLDPIYEAKCLQYLENNDLFWIIGKRRNV